MTPQISSIVNSAGLLLLKSPTTGTFARDAVGEPIKPYENAAKSFCLIGALKKCTREYFDLSFNDGSIKSFNILLQNVIITVRDGALKRNESLTFTWENTNDQGRAKIATLLSNVDVSSWTPKKRKHSFLNNVIKLDHEQIVKNLTENSNVKES